MQKASRLCIRFFGLSAFVAAVFLYSAAPAKAGTDDNVTGWLWSGTVGWISLNCTDLGTCATADYGVTIENAPGFGDRGDLKGWAWSETMGWICFGVTCTGPTPEGGGPYAQYRANFNGKQDQIFGWANVVNLGDRGWIALNCDKDNDALDSCGTANHYVVLNTALSSGNFTKGLFNDHYGWNGNDDGTGIGWVQFTTYASTTWTLAKLGKVRRPEGVYEPSAGGLAGTHLFTFGIGFVGFSAPEDNVIECEIELPDLSTKVLRKVLPATVRDPPGTESLTYTIAAADPIEQNELWYLNACRIEGTVTAIGCASNVNCTVCSGGFCNVTGKTCATAADCAGTAVCDITGDPDLCRPVIDSWTGKRPIFVHGNEWTGLDAETDDQLRAVRCSAGLYGQYFNNPSRCDFAGDASFSLAMRRGVPIEGDCDDGVDNDGNGQADCDGDVNPPGPGPEDLPPDRYCQGISYRCTAHAPTRCVWGEAGGIDDCSDPGYQAGWLCCSRQPVAEASPGINHVVNGLECTRGDANDGYFDCSCTTLAEFNASAGDDCFAPGYQAGDLCCSADDEVIKL